MKKLYTIILLSIFIFTTNFKVAENIDMHNMQIRTIQCYPNPATSFINFEFATNTEKQNYTLAIYSFIGNKMSEVSVTTSKIVLTLETYQRGLYVFQLKNKAGQIIESGKFQVVK
ncbi:MAG: T9SS type A sorting domain-containing protein [Bacteroidetes bacterium]|nr:T9SS type A sorting domain-containing protein [Bacteroidota bacterium]MBS1649518.1 T9SS type A sorting domain-containing protein [Bacteroidota bacterium]